MFDVTLPRSASPSSPIENLRSRVDAILKVFDDPCFRDFDVPAWANRATSHGDFEYRYFTISNFIRVMCDTAADLGLEDGERYVLSAICACAERVERDDSVVAETRGEAIARGLQVQATIWIAFLFWPVYARKDEDMVMTGYDTPPPGVIPRTTATAGVDPEAADESPEFRDKVLWRDGHRCVLTGAWDSKYWYSRMYGKVPESDAGLRGTLYAVRIFKHPLVLYDKRVDGAGENDKSTVKSATITSGLLRRYCQLSDKHDSPDVMRDPENAISLMHGYNAFFHAFSFCFAATETPNTYRLKDYEPSCNMFSTFGVPETITFRNYGLDDNNGRPASPGPLPSPELLRLHAALAGVIQRTSLFRVFMIVCGRGKRGLQVPGPNGVSFWKEVVGTDFDLDLDRLMDVYGTTAT